jgi:hypothetical protein
MKFSELKAKVVEALRSVCPDDTYCSIVVELNHDRFGGESLLWAVYSNRTGEVHGDCTPEAAFEKFAKALGLPGAPCELESIDA